jgi:protein gp37
MADQGTNGISWTDATWNPVVGCSIVSPACTNCYAMAQAARIERMTGGNTHYAGTTKVVNGKPVWTGKLVLAPDHILTAPLRWRRPRRVFVNSMSDLFHEDMPDEWIDQVFAIMALAQRHTFQCLSKRPERMMAYLSDSATVDRIAALVYSARHGQRDNSPDEWAVPGEPGRDDLASREAARSRRDAGRRILSGRDHLAVHAGSSGVSNEGRLPAGLRHDQRDEDHDISAQAGVGGDQRTYLGGHDDQPQGRREGEQSAGEFGVGDDERAAPSRAGCSVGGAPSPYWLETPEDDAGGSGRSGNPAEASERRARDRHSRIVSHEAKGNQRNLHAQDLDAHLVWPLANVWLGVTAEDQARADERIPDLLATPAALRFVSAEPLLGPVSFHGMLHRLDWIIVGGESGRGSRPTHPDWVRAIRDQCAEAGVAFHFKQRGDWSWLEPGDGEWPTDMPKFCRLGADGRRSPDGWPMQWVGKHFAGRLLDGVIHDAFPVPK